MYNNLVFDLGGVVVNYNPKDYLVDKFFHEKIEKQIYNAVFGSPEWAMLDRGEITLRQANDIFMRRGRDRDIAFEMQAVVDEWMEMLSTRVATVNLMRLFKKKGFHLYYLSNISREALNLLKSRDFWPLFEGGVASCNVGVSKPELEIYKNLLDSYGLVPQETIFIDDRKENASSAFLAGITGIHFTDVKSLCEMLVTYGVDIEA